MKLRIPKNVKWICHQLHKADFEAWVVGGCIRDALLGRLPHDWDIATDALPNDVLALFPGSLPTGVEFGTITVKVKEKHYEVTTFRKDGNYGDGRRPDNVEFGKTIQEDLSRRDFTINAMAFNPTTKKFVDPFNGSVDLNKKILCTVGKAEDRFNEDGLRLMRAARFCATHELSLDELTERGMSVCFENTLNVSRERIRDELLKTLLAEKPSVGFEILRKTGILEVIFPELVQQFGCEQNYHHKFDVWNHTMVSVDSCRTSDVILKLTVLLHDIGKVATKAINKRGEFSFYKHPEVGAKIADKWLKKFKFSNKDRERVVLLVKRHLILYDSKWKIKAIRHFINRVGVENLEDLFKVVLADILGKGVEVPETLSNLVELIVRVEEVIKSGVPLVKTDLDLNGDDVLEILGIKSGPIVGKSLDFLFRNVLGSPELNTKERLTKLLVKNRKSIERL